MSEMKLVTKKYIQMQCVPTFKWFIFYDISSCYDLLKVFFEIQSRKKIMHEKKGQ